MKNLDSFSLRFKTNSASRNNGWMKYFIAAVGMGAGVADAQQQQVMLDYWWVMPEYQMQYWPQAYRVSGEKGAHFEQISIANQCKMQRHDPAIKAARIERQRALRREATAIMRKLMAEDPEKARSTAYAEAWTRVFSRRWLSAHGRAGSSALEEMLLRMAHHNYTQLTKAEEQWVLEALLEDDDRLETREGLKLLQLLTHSLREQGYGRFYSSSAVYDELMQRFADALSSGQNSMVAYRDAMFKTHRDRVMHHELVGYRAPWGMGVSRGAVYSQAPQQVGTTLGSGNSSQLLLTGASPTAPSNSFLATAPESDEDEDKEQEEKEDDTDDNTLTSNDSDGSAPATPPMMMMSSMSLRSASAAVMAAADETATADVNADFTVKSNASYHVGGQLDSLNGASWSSNRWRYGTEVDNDAVLIEINGGNLYLGNGYEGDVRVNTSGTVHAEGVSGNLSKRPAAGTGVYTYGTLSGSGTLTLSNNGKPTSSFLGSTAAALIYRFNDAGSTDETWFEGTVRFAASQGAPVQLDLAPQGSATTAWAGVEMDMTARTQATDGYGISKTNLKAPSRTILTLGGDVQLAGLKGGGSYSSVTNLRGDVSHTLILGEKATDSYVYDGGFGGNYYTSANNTATPTVALSLTKLGEYQQTFTAATATFHTLSVESGTLRFDDSEDDADESYSGVVNTGSLSVNNGTLKAGNLNITQTLQPAQITNAGKVDVTHKITAAYNINVDGRGTVNAADMEAGNIVTVSGALTSVTIGDGSAGLLKAVGLTISNGAHVSTHDATISGAVQIGLNDADAVASLTTSGAFSADSLRVRKNGSLTTSGTDAHAVTLAYLHGGAQWYMEGSANSISGTMYVEGWQQDTGLVCFNDLTQSGSAVLTMPGTVDFSKAGWNDDTAAVFRLDGVKLDFSKVVTFTNFGFDITLPEGEGDSYQKIKLAESVSGSGNWYQNGGRGVYLISDGKRYHGELVSENGAIYIQVMHEATLPYTLASGKMMYIEMYEDAYMPALPYDAHDTYNNGWSGTPFDENPGELMLFANTELSEGANLYLGENDDSEAARAHRHFGGNITIMETGSEVAGLHGEIGRWGNWNLDGHLGGEGDFRLLAHHDNTGSVTGGSTTTDGTTVKTTVHGTAGTFTFNNAATPESWFSGTLSLANTHGGIVQLNIGNVNIAGKGDTRWQNTLIDLSRNKVTDAASKKSGSAKEVVLGIMGDATVAGLQGGDAESYVVSERRASSTASNPVLTIGSANDYTFGGTIGSGRFYTGGQAYTIETTATGASASTRQEVNYRTMGNGRLNLVKVGTGKQTFTGKVYLDSAEVREGTLEFAGTIANDVKRLTIHSGATAIAGAGNFDTDILTLHGGATLRTNIDDTDSYDTLVYINNVFGENIQSITIGSSDDSQIKWHPSRYLSFENAGAWNDDWNGGTTPVFMLDNVTIVLEKPRVITNMAGIDGGESIALYGGVESFSVSSASGMVMVEDDHGNFYDATYRTVGNIVYLDLAEIARDYGIVVENPAAPDDDSTTLEHYIWSGVKNNGHTISDVHHIDLVMGNIWRADGSAENTGWHEQRAAGSSNNNIGIYENGHHVYFGDKDVHGKDSPYRLVDIKGKVAPGLITIDTSVNQTIQGASDGEARMKYAYAFQSLDGTGSIVDISDANPTSMVKTGDGMLILNTSNSFSGGIDVQDGALYLAVSDAQGTGTLQFHTDKVWAIEIAGTTNNTGQNNNYWVTLQDKAEYNNGHEPYVGRLGAEMMVSYRHNTSDVSAYRSGLVANDIVMTRDADTPDSVNGQFRISFAHSSFNSARDGSYQNHEDIPRHWRSLTLSGSLVGTGRRSDTLYLTGYCSTWWKNVHDQCYVTAFNLKEEDNVLYLEGQQRFNGTVILENTVNTSPIYSNRLGARNAGAIQVTLSGKKLMNAKLDLSRESVICDYDVTHNCSDFNKDGKKDPRQSLNSILVLENDSYLRGLSADFRGCAYMPDGDDRQFVANLNQGDEVWHVRTVAAAESTLWIGDSEQRDDTSTYVYSGAMGFRQSYVGPSEAHVPWGDGFDETSESGGSAYTKDFGGHSMAEGKLSLAKYSQTQQYIHSARLEDLSLYEGTLGFNNLALNGNMNLVGGTTLKLGVTTDAGWDKVSGTSSFKSRDGKAYERVDTTSTATVHAGKNLTVYTNHSTPTVSGSDVLNIPTAAKVEGDLVLEAGSALTFRVSTGQAPYWISTGTSTTEKMENSIVPLLTVEGSLTLPTAVEDLDVSLVGIDFSTINYTGKRYYLASAENILTSAGEPADTVFVPRTISLGYGYFGTIYTIGNLGSSNNTVDSAVSATRDYLVMTVNGDPRHTWHGYTSDYTWTVSAGVDHRWKENQGFQHGRVVLFGNLKTPKTWAVDRYGMTSDESVNVLASVEQPGVLLKDIAEDYNFNIDGHVVKDRSGEDAFQAVKVSGRVAPFSIIINSNYNEFESKDATIGVEKTDGTNYYFYTTETDKGYIDDAEPDELKKAHFDESWKTMLHKTGSGNTVMALDNRYTGGSVLQGSGIMVMQHVNALGHVYDETRQGRAGENKTPEDDSTFVPYDATITLMGGAGLMGDFDDKDYPGNYTGSKVSEIGYMYTTTINNKIVVTTYVNPDQPDNAYASEVDGRVINSYDKKLILDKLVGESDTVLELVGVGLSDTDAAKQGGKYRYGVFKVIDPSQFYGTVTMRGHVWGDTTGYQPGRVQLDIMSTSKSFDGADWTNATIDMTADGTTTERTVLGLDATGQLPDDASYEYCILNSITGSVAEGGSSSVLNMSKSNPVTLILKGGRSGNYEGVLGYGDFQVAVNYGGYSDVGMGTTQHHYGADGHGDLSVIKRGDNTTQRVRRAWLKDLTVESGAFHVTEALVAGNITAGSGKRVFIGDEVNTASLYALTVGSGVLAMNTTFTEIDSDAKQDALAGIGAGTYDSNNKPAGYVLLMDGAVLSAREDWFTQKLVNIATSANVTVNTHNFAIDPYITKENDVFGKFTHSHIIQMTGEITGTNVHLTVNNRLTDPDEGDAYVDLAEDSLYMGYVALNDLNSFTGGSKVDVDSMTVLQILKNNAGGESDTEITVEGANATLQILNKVVSYNNGVASTSDSMQQYLHKVTLGLNKDTNVEADPISRVNNGQIMLGGEEVNSLYPATGSDPISKPDDTGMKVLISSRHNSLTDQGMVEKLHVDLRNSSGRENVRMGGDDAQRATLTNVHVDMHRSNVGHVLHDTNLVNSMVHLMEDCSVDISDAVLVDQKSVVRGVSLIYQDAAPGEISQVMHQSVSPVVGPNAAVGNDATSTTREVRTSASTQVELTFADYNRNSDRYTVGSTNFVVLQTEQFLAVDLYGDGLTIKLSDETDIFTLAYQEGARFIGVMVGGQSGQFLYESQHEDTFASLLGSQFVLQDANGENLAGHWVTATYVSENVGTRVSNHMLYFEVPEPATATLSLLALTALMARRRRKS